MQRLVHMTNFPHMYSLMGVQARIRFSRVTVKVLDLESVYSWL